jgi:hypothetical protein
MATSDATLAGINEPFEIRGDERFRDTVEKLAHALTASAAR